MYSWANHGWVTTVATVLIGPWLLALATRDRPSSAVLLSVGPAHLRAESFPSLVLTLAALAQIRVLPLLGAAADRRSLRRIVLLGATVLGCVAAGSLALTSGGEYVVAGVLFLVGSVAYGAANLLYNSLLPQLAEPADRDTVSSRAFAFGYLGGGLLLALNLLLLLLHASVGLDKAAAVRICFLSAGLWWAGFGLRALRPLIGVDRHILDDSGESPVDRLVSTVRFVLARRQTRRYLLSYLLFSDAISAVIGLSSTFITHELYGDSASRAATFLFELILLIQFVAMGGAVLFGRMAARLGAQRSILLSLVVWVLAIVYTYAELRSRAQAVLVGVVIGLVLGGSQALARSLWAQLVPPGRESSYFGLFEVANEGTAWAAPLLFTIVVNATGSFRQAILSLLVLFVAGGLLLAQVDVDAAIAESHTAGPLRSRTG
jgi:UMF1 family MFS transporter